MNDEYAAGEVLSSKVVQRDADGKIIGEVIWNTYGYDNAMANFGGTRMVEKLVELAKEWDAIKNPKAAPPGQAK